MILLVAILNYGITGSESLLAPCLGFTTVSISNRRASILCFWFIFSGEVPSIDSTLLNACLDVEGLVKPGGQAAVLALLEQLVALVCASKSFTTVLVVFQVP